MTTTRSEMRSLFPTAVELDSETFSSGRTLLEFTLADGTTCGFPLSWLYRYEHVPEEDGERLVLQFAEHRVTIRGQPLDQLQRCLHNGEGFHVYETPQRYLTIKREAKSFIESILIELLNRTPTEQTN